jgi:hypothetical protein
MASPVASTIAAPPAGAGPTASRGRSPGPAPAAKYRTESDAGAHLRLPADAAAVAVDGPRGGGKVPILSSSPTRATGGPSVWGRTPCVLVVLAALGTFAIAVAGLVIAIASWRPEVVSLRTAASPAGYTYGGAVYQGSGAWVAKASLPSPRSDLTATVVADVIWLVGGASPNGTVLASVMTFDPIFEA